jgi:hypothetical protein
MRAPMQITLQKNTVTLSPGTPEEQAKLLAVWRLLVHCNGLSRKLAPIGEFVPAKNRPAQFLIEGPGAESLPDIPAVVVEEDSQVYCKTCNRIQSLKRGQRIPPCCGKLMEIMD